MFFALPLVKYSGLKLMNDQISSKQSSLLKSTLLATCRKEYSVSVPVGGRSREENFGVVT